MESYAIYWHFNKILFVVIQVVYFLLESNYYPSEVLNSNLCPQVDNDEFAQEVENEVEDSMITLPVFDSTLQNFTSIVRFVRESVLCNK